MKRSEEVLSREILDSSEYINIQKNIEALSSVLIVIEEGIQNEITQIKTLNKMISAQKMIIKDTLDCQVVSMYSINRLKRDMEILKKAAIHKTETARNLNRYLRERMRHMETLKLKRKSIIDSFATAEIIHLRGTNE